MLPHITLMGFSRCRHNYPHLAGEGGEGAEAQRAELASQVGFLSFRHPLQVAKYFSDSLGIYGALFL